MSERCLKGRTDYEACFAPFRYCPEMGCGRAEGDKQLPTQQETPAWAKGITDQPLGEPVLAELRDNPVNPETLDPHSRWVEHKIHRVVWRHAFTDHDCQFTGCLSMMIAESPEMRDVLVEAYERGQRDARGLPWEPGEYDDGSVTQAVS